MKQPRKLGCFGFSRTDLLFTVIGVTAIAFFCVALILPAMTKYKNGPGPPNCVNNLKQVGLAFRLWASDHNEKFPMQVSTNDGGVLELLGGSNFVGTFETMSNELSTPKILVCPKDKNKTIATNFSTNLDVNHLSYFLGLDAQSELTNSFLSGDRNLTNGMPMRKGILEVVKNHPVGWTEEIHHLQGNILFSDGSAWQFANPELHPAVLKTGLNTNRLALP